jgi:hypothetical protein
VAFTVKQYIQTGPEADRQVTNTLAELGVSCVAFTSSVMLDTCGTQRRKTLIASRAFLHFHEDAGDLYVDVRLDSAFQRVGVTSPNEQAGLLSLVRKALQSTTSADTTI